MDYKSELEGCILVYFNSFQNDKFLSRQRRQRDMAIKCNAFWNKFSASL